MQDQYDYLSFGFEIISNLDLDLYSGLSIFDQSLDEGNEGLSRKMMICAQGQSHLALGMIWQCESFTFEDHQLEAIQSDLLKNHLCLKGKFQDDFTMENLPFLMVTSRFDQDRGPCIGEWAGWGDGEIWLPRLLISKNLVSSSSEEQTVRYRFIYHMKVNRADDLSGIHASILKFLDEIVQIRESRHQEEVFLGFQLFLQRLLQIDSSFDPSHQDCFLSYFNQMVHHTTKLHLYDLSDLLHLMPMHLQAQYSMLLEKKLDQEKWESLVFAAKSACQRGENGIEKIVCARSTHLDLSQGVFAEHDFDLSGGFRKICEAFEQANCYWISKRTANGRLDFMGATPETLFTIDHQFVKTHALAGTIKNVDDLGEKLRLQHCLLEDAKERKEHALVVDSIMSALKSMGFEEITYDQKPHIKEIGRLQHLESHVICQMPKGDEDLVGFRKLHQLHPTPALGGRPKAQALSWLRMHENLERGNYGAPFGWLGFTNQGHLKHAHFYVGIRGCLLSQVNAHQSLHFFAGVGVVSESDPLKEWQESQMKMSVLLPFLRWRKKDEGV